jgi:hypothetical protein
MIRNPARDGPTSLVELVAEVLSAIADMRLSSGTISENIDCCGHGHCNHRAV